MCETLTCERWYQHYESRDCPEICSRLLSNVLASESETVKRKIRSQLYVLTSIVTSCSCFNHEKNSFWTENLKQKTSRWKSLILKGFNIRCTVTFFTPSTVQNSWYCSATTAPQSHMQTFHSLHPSMFHRSIPLNLACSGPNPRTQPLQRLQWITAAQLFDAVNHIMLVYNFSWWTNCACTD